MDKIDTIEKLIEVFNEFETLRTCDNHLHIDFINEKINEFRQSVQDRIAKLEKEHLGFDYLKVDELKRLIGGK